MSKLLRQYPRSNYPGNDQRDILHRCHIDNQNKTSCNDKDRLINQTTRIIEIMKEAQGRKNIRPTYIVL